MTPAEQKERNFKLSKSIIDHFGQSFFRGKKILDLGSGNGELANIFAKLGSDITCVDAREQNLQIIRKNFPYIKTAPLDLEEEFPFENFSFDLVLSVDLLCHMRYYAKHIEQICSAAEHIVLETEVLDTQDHNLLVPIFESRDIDSFSFSGEGCLVSDKAIQNKLSSMNAKYKRVDETKLNHGQFRYDWKANDVGRKFGNRRLWFIRRDQHLVKKLKASQTVKETQVEYSQLFLNSTNKSKTVVGKSVNQRDPNNPQIIGPAPVLITVPAGKTVYVSAKRKRFVIVIPSYNNQTWAERNILSALNQNYDDFRIIFTDDCSSDQTYRLVRDVVNNSPHKHKCKVIKNNTRIGALANLYNMIHSCDDDEIIITLDGDDHLAGPEVLNKLKKHYDQNDIWMSFGQYRNSTDGGIGVAAPYPKNVIDNNGFRTFRWGASHLRSFYSWLFKKIKKEDLYYNGSFFEMSWDLCTMIPMIEMCKYHHKYIDEVLYIYNLSNPISDHMKNVKLQQSLDKHIRKMPRYSPILNPMRIVPDVGLIIIATGKYDRFIDDLISSADNHFLKDKANITYYIFTDKIDYIINSNRNHKIIQVEHEPFPKSTMNRFKFIIENENQFSNEDYLYYIDVDTKIVDHIGEEIFGNLTTVRHCGFTSQPGPFESDPNSAAYVDVKTHKLQYMGGGFNGGKKNSFIQLAKWCYEALKKDEKNGKTPIWHDESVLQRYIADHPPEVILDCGYHYPESNIDHYKKLWGNETFKKKILLLDKDHNKVRNE